MTKQTFIGVALGSMLVALIAGIIAGSAYGQDIAVRPESSGSHFGAVLLVAVMAVVAGLVVLRVKRPAVYAKIMAAGKTVGAEVKTGAGSAVAAAEAGYHAAVASAAATNAASPPTAAGPPTTK